MDQIVCWRLATSDLTNSADRLKKAGFTLHDEEPQLTDYALCDDHDWSLWSDNALLLRDDCDNLVFRHQGMQLCAKGPKQDLKFFWWDLPGGLLQDRLKQAIPLRALLPRYQFNLRTQQLFFLNPDDKTVVKGSLYSLNDGNGETHNFLELRQLRGYGKEFSCVAKAFSDLMTGDVPDCQLSTLLQQTGLKVEALAGKVTFALQSQQQSEPAICRMALKMVQLARHQEAGMIADIDTEFVHQYRVNLRKTRSLISLFRKSLSSERYRALKTELKEVASRTNELRDLDVFLLDREYYRDMLPASLHPGFEQLFRYVKRRRRSACTRVIKHLSGEAYLEQISRTLILLQQEEEFSAKQSAHTIGSLSAAKIMAQYQRILRDGAAIGEESADEEVHDLRIECKKLRYLLELFIELYPEKPVKTLIKHLKGLQDNLGRFNDFCVQQDFLLSLDQGKRLTPAAQTSLNALVTVLFNNQRQERNRVVKNINRFSDNAVVKEFHCLFDQPAREDTEQ